MTSEALVIGAGPAGLAAAAALKMRGIEAVVLERAENVGASWRGHYDRLHLHTHKNRSGLPGYPMPRSFPRYPSRDEVVAYLEDYAAHHGIAPEFGVDVQAVRRAGDHWHIEGAGRDWTARHVIVATGPGTHPFRADWPGLEGFSGNVLHSSDYRTGADFADRRVLVVGFGNSGGEIAVDLAEHGAEVALSVRGPVNVIPKEMFGLPVTSLTFLQKIFPPGIADALTAPLVRAFVGDIRKVGLQKLDKGPVRQIREDGRVPLIDIGTMAMIRAGRITVRRAPDRIDGATVHFTDGTTGDFDAIVLATGYRPDLRGLLPDAGTRLSETGAPRDSGAEGGADGLWFVSFRQSSEGQIFAMSKEAEAVAEKIAGWK